MAAPQLPLKLPLEQTNLVHRMFQGLGEMPFFLLQQAGAQEVLYGYVGTDDYTLDPIIRPGASCKSIRSKTKSFEVCGRANTNARSILWNYATTVMWSVGANSRGTICFWSLLQNLRCPSGIYHIRRTPTSWVVSQASLT